MSPRLKHAVKRIKCVSCKKELITHTTNYCAVCLHNGELSRLGHPFFQRPHGEFPEPMQMSTETEKQTGIGDWV